MQIIFAGYGVWNTVKDVTHQVQLQYDNKLQPPTRTFYANNRYWGDPYPGERKYLFIVWNKAGVHGAGVIGEDDANGITLP